MEPEQKAGRLSLFHSGFLPLMHALWPATATFATGVMLAYGVGRALKALSVSDGAVIFFAAFLVSLVVGEFVLIKQVFAVQHCPLKRKSQMLAAIAIVVLIALLYPFAAFMALASGMWFGMRF